MQPWPGEVLEERAGEIAVAFAALLNRHAAWRHRRVETITVLSHEQVRRHVSVDFTVPLEHREEMRLSEHEWIVPLALLAKRPLVHFDLRSEDETAVPLLRSDEARLIARELLYLALDVDAESADTVDATPLIEWILAAKPEEAGADRRRARRARGPARAAARVHRARGPLTSGFLLCAVLNDVDRRRVIKFAYDEPLGQPGRAAHFYDAPGCTEAASYHAEVDVPDEMRARTTRMIDNRTGLELAAGPRDADRPAIHYVADVEGGIEPGLSVTYGTERGRFLVPAALVAWVIALGLTLSWLFSDLGALATSGGPAIAVLLSTSAMFSGLVLRSRRAPAGAARARALPAVPGGGDGRGRGGRRLARLPRLHRDAGGRMGSRRPCGHPVRRYPECRGRARSVRGGRDH